MRSRRLFTSLVVPLLLGCSDSPTEGGGTDHLRHSYSGSYSGRFDATGTLDVSAAGRTVAPHSYAIAVRSDSTPMLTIIAYELGRSGRGNATAFVLHDAVRGDYPLTFLSCLFTEGKNCSLGIFLRDVPYLSPHLDQDGDEEGEAMVFEKGLLKIAEISDARVKGSFSGEASIFSPETGPFGGRTGSVVISEGTFDVRIVWERDLPQDLATSYRASVQSMSRVSAERL